jgi:aminoglycoside phosphotransferase family enzyme
LNTQVEPTLSDKVAFLSRAETYAHPVDTVTCRETHMSWVFLAGDKVYKLKKPVRFPYLDFSTCARREAMCRAEFSLNRRLAADVYVGIVPLVVSGHGLSLGGGGTVVDWLVVMNRLDERWSLEQLINSDALERTHLQRLVMTLTRFYRRARPVLISPDAHLSEWSRNLAMNRSMLLDPRLSLPARLVRRVDRVLSRFLTERRGALVERVRRRRIVDGHGDLRPEHIWLNDHVRIIDCLEFNARLRAIDPLDEVAFLTLECERLGAPWAGQYIRTGIERGLREQAPSELFLFYRAYRAMLRARLAIAHLLDAHPRAPEKWPRQARAYLAIAARDASRLERCLRKRRGP